jgi:alcohol dehydrogenase class IV
VNIPEHLSAYGVSEDAFDAIIEESLPSGSLQHNPRPLAAEDVRRILEAAL